MEPIDRAGIGRLAIECAFGDAPFVLEASPNVLHVRGRDVMWQKERLLNAALAHVPAAFTKIVWLDCDILFEEREWAPRTSALLDAVPLVQPFDRAIRLPRGHTYFNGEGNAWDGFAAVHSRRPAGPPGNDFPRHGHTGFAWAARREMLAEHGLYDAGISGSGDHLMAHAFCGDWDARCVERILTDNEAQRRHYREWARRIHRDVASRMAFVPGTLLHLWHGDPEGRRYLARNQELAEFGFDPYRDIRVGVNGCWEWHTDKPMMHQWAVRYFAGRQEDG